MITNPIQVKIINLNLLLLQYSNYFTIIPLYNYLDISGYPIILKTTCSTIARYQVFLQPSLKLWHHLFCIIFHNIAPLKFSEFLPYFVPYNHIRKQIHGIDQRLALISDMALVSVLRSETKGFRFKSGC